jgi:signal transduction histidine kinase
LGAGTVLLLFIKNIPPIFITMTICDYIIILLYQYFEPHYIFMEFIWMPVSLITLLVAIPSPYNNIVVFLIGLPGTFFLSYGFTGEAAISVGENRYPYYYIPLFIYVPLTFLFMVTRRSIAYMEQLKARINALKEINSRLGKVNRGITYKMFNLQNDISLEVRKRISKDIHDTAGYVFINLIMMLQATSAVLYKDIKKAETLINDARDYADRGINEIRYLLREIRDYANQHISLQNELYDISQSFSKATDISLTVNYGNWPQTFSDKIDAFFKSFMQEALTNALKHGGATEITVFCRIDADRSIMTVSDNGRGAEIPVKKGIGISAMEDFVHQAGGSVEIRSNGNGFAITVSVPLQASSSGS